MSRRYRLAAHGSARGVQPSTSAPVSAVFSVAGLPPRLTAFHPSLGDHTLRLYGRWAGSEHASSHEPRPAPRRHRSSLTTTQSGVDCGEMRPSATSALNPRSSTFFRSESPTLPQTSICSSLALNGECPQLLILNNTISQSRHGIDILRSPATTVPISSLIAVNLSNPILLNCLSFQSVGLNLIDAHEIDPSSGGSVLFSYLLSTCVPSGRQDDATPQTPRFRRVHSNQPRMLQVMWPGSSV
jgi:hypothetical protein